VAALLDQPGIPAKKAIGILENLGKMKRAERQAIYRLNESESSRTAGGAHESRPDAADRESARVGPDIAEPTGISPRAQGETERHRRDGRAARGPVQPQPLTAWRQARIVSAHPAGPSRPRRPLEAAMSDDCRTVLQDSGSVSRRAETQRAPLQGGDRTPSFTLPAADREGSVSLADNRGRTSLRSTSRPRLMRHVSRPRAVAAVAMPERSRTIRQTGDQR